MANDITNYIGVVAAREFADQENLRVFKMARRGVTKDDVRDSILESSDEEKRDYGIREIVACVIFTVDEFARVERQLPTYVADIDEFYKVTSGIRPEGHQQIA